MVSNYGSVPSISDEVPRTRSRFVNSAVACLAAVALVAVVAVARGGPSVLMNKEAAGWRDTTPVTASEGRWDQGWLKHFVHGKAGGGGKHMLAQHHRSLPSSSDAEQANLDGIHDMLGKAVGMLNDLEKDHQKRAGFSTLEATPAPAAEPAGTTAPAGTPAPSDGQANLAKEQPMCFKINNLDVAKLTAENRKSEAEDNLALAYPEWGKGQKIPGRGQYGEWQHNKGPPYAERLVMFSGAGVNDVGSGTLVRRILGLHTTFQRPCDLRSCDHAWSNNNYIKSFEGPQFRFLYRNQCSTIVVPPLTRGAGPVLSDDALYRLHHYLKDGYNTLIVLGSTPSVLFINQNLATLDGGFDLEPDWVEGPFEAQAAQTSNTPFSTLAITMPSPGVTVTGVRTSSLPANAISYYEAEGVSVMFEIPFGTGRILYLGYDFSEPVTPWVHALVAATMFNDFDFNAPKKV